ncbi:hypothetical protein QUW41_00145 [Slackia piriformis]|nr:hypothetical protein [Slackia piriformis]
MDDFVNYAKWHRVRMVLAIATVGIVLVIVCIAIAIWAHGAREFRDVRLADAAFYDSVVESEQAYLLKTQAEDGALLYVPKRNGEVRVVPYFSSLGALGLLEGGPTETESKRFSAVESYLVWYGDHLENGARENLPKGSIADYSLNVSDGAIIEESRANPDSIDSYAATYITVLSAYYNAGGNTAFVQERAEDTRMVIEVLLGTIGPNGLSCVSPDNDTNYLMDNVEVLAALRAVPLLVERVWLPASPQLEAREWSSLAQRCVASAAVLEQAIFEILWDADNERFLSGIDASSGNEIVWEGWDDFYPSAVAQIAPAAWAGGFSTDIIYRSRGLYSDFCAAWKWEDFEYVDEGAATFYWGMIAYAAASLGDEGRARIYLEEYMARVEKSDHEWPLYIADASWASRTAALLADAARGDAAKADPIGLLGLIP